MCAWVPPELHALLFDEWRDIRRNNIETHLNVFSGNAFFRTNKVQPALC